MFRSREDLKSALSHVDTSLLQIFLKIVTIGPGGGVVCRYKFILLRMGWGGGQGLNLFLNNHLKSFNIRGGGPPLFSIALKL